MDDAPVDALWGVDAGTAVRAGSVGVDDVDNGVDGDCGGLPAGGAAAVPVGADGVDIAGETAAVSALDGVAADAADCWAGGIAAAV